MCIARCTTYGWLARHLQAIASGLRTAGWLVSAEHAELYLYGRSISILIFFRGMLKPVLLHYLSVDVVKQAHSCYKTPRMTQARSAKELHLNAWKL